MRFIANCQAPVFAHCHPGWRNRKVDLKINKNKVQKSKNKYPKNIKFIKEHEHKITLFFQICFSSFTQGRT